MEKLLEGALRILEKQYLCDTCDCDFCTSHSSCSKCPYGVHPEHRSAAIEVVLNYLNWEVKAK